MSLSFNSSQKCSHIDSKHCSCTELDLDQTTSSSNMERRSMNYHDKEKLFSYSLNSLAKRDDSLEDDATGSGTGLVGLQNIANTCYMNSALQALSNLSPVTHYFINCSEIVEHIASTPRSKVAGLAKSYQRLMQEIWMQADESRDNIAPRGILYGIRSVHPMFRGYQQHDTQEFLRCFMDQLHEELTEQINAPVQQQQPQQQTPPQPVQQQASETDDDENCDDEQQPKACNTPTASESEYDTCESSISERSSEVLMRTDYFAAPQRLSSSSNPVSDASGGQQQQSPKTSQESKQVEAARSIISDVFDGKLLSSVQCLTCDRISTREETFQDLSLPIPNRDFLNVLHQTHSLSVQSLNAADLATARSNEGWISWMWNMVRSWLFGPSVTLYDCMASFFSADELKGDNMYSCERCNKLRTGIKYSRVLNLPEVLCIHLKRFRHDLSYSSKISSYVYFPLEGFDMRPYLDKNCKSQVPTYNLCSVICHHGTVGGGHYTCYARNSLNGRWYEFDDQFVTEVSPEVVQNCQAYVLFYQKHNPQMQMLREEAINLSTANPLYEGDIQFYVTREWLSRLATFSEPGPINNQEMLCPHGGILHSKAALISQIAVPIPQPLWDFLYNRFGGGPAVNIMFECEICKRAADALSRRQLYELAVFTKYNGLQNELDTTAIYAIAMPWLRAWQQFSRGITHKEPGPINNEGIADTNSHNGSAISCVRAGSDYAQLNSLLWRFLHGIYGGGPEIMLRSALSDDEADEIEIIDQDDEEDEDEDLGAIYMNNQSDTESNPGRLNNTDSPIASSTLTPEPLPSVEDETPTIKSEPATSDTMSNGSNSNSTASKRGKSGGKAIKVAALRMNMRKRGRNRNAMKVHAEMFGAKGQYNPQTDATAESKADADQTNEVRDKDQRSAAATTTATTAATATPATGGNAFQTEYTIPFQSDNFQVNGPIDKKRERRKLRNNNKENVKLQKFVTLREANGANDETDI
ncbi:ubiquitin carboxyl-terminal hydrolase 20 [Drosophila albomicans]|uniref:Ubiquitin carboxyl-terminal hydrolase n=1 Tax=Drosophila albomicans TaxID=7291 RepID=A0A6P8Z2H6_DROAB|nr:ubiquitin carboxyl-terminal hydrolase 20 [Drosophila albomicans]